jgi:hypothetical protein
LCEEVPRQKAAESRKIPESGSVIPREGVESTVIIENLDFEDVFVIPREGVERQVVVRALNHFKARFDDVIPREGVESSWQLPTPYQRKRDPERGS